MKTFNKQVLVLGLALVFGAFCHGQTFPRAGANPNLAPARTITGTVCDPSGAPAPGVLLLVVDPVNGPGLDIKSDAGGKYAISWRSPRTTRTMVVDGMTVGGTPVDRFCTLVARDVAHNFATALEIGDTTTNLDLRLQPGLAISFKVEDPTGKPVTNATANLGTFFSGVGFMLIFNPPTYADDKGVIRMAGLPQGYDYTMNIRAPGHGSAVTTTAEDQTQTARLDLPPVVLKLANLKLAGQVLDADGKPAIATRVSLLGAGQPGTNTESDATGHFSFEVCEGAVSFIAGMGGVIGRAQAMGGDTNVVIRLRNNNVVAEAANANAAAAARRTVTITGTVFDPSGAPAPGVEMSLMPRGQSQDSKSDAGGKFTVSWPPVIAWMGMTPPVIELLVGRDLEHNFAATASVDENTTNMDLHLKAGLVLSGSVQDNNGAAVNTATVRLTLTTLSSRSAVGAQPATVDEQGAFTFSALPQGRAYDLTVTAPGFAFTNVLLAATGTQMASLKLPPIKLKPMNKRLEGWVVGPDDKPVPGAMVMVSGPGQATASARTDANGHFALMVCEGTIRVTAMVPINQNNNGQLRSTSVQAHSGDLDVVLKLGVPAPAPRGNNPAPPSNPPLIGPLL
jgi:hypothetical protein